jgi:chromosome partitioning protein
VIVAVLGEKGGTGKTTFSTNLAGMRSATGRDVLVVDADRQGSASYWAEAREEKGLTSVSCVQKFGDGLARAIRDMSRRYDDVIIDIASGDSRDIEGALRVADKVIIPVQPSGIDLWTLGLLDDRISQARQGNTKLTAHVVINRASTNPRDNDAEDAKSAMAVCDTLNITDVVVRDRVSIKRSVPAGITADEYKPLDSKAALEMTALYKLAFGENGYKNGN